MLTQVRRVTGECQVVKVRLGDRGWGGVPTYRGYLSRLS